MFGITSFIMYFYLGTNNSYLKKQYDIRKKLRMFCKGNMAINACSSTVTRVSHPVAIGKAVQALFLSLSSRVSLSKRYSARLHSKDLSLQLVGDMAPNSLMNFTCF